MTVDAGVDARIPLHIVHVAVPGTAPAAIHPRTLVIAARRIAADARRVVRRAATRDVSDERRDGDHRGRRTPRSRT